MKLSAKLLRIISNSDEKIDVGVGEDVCASDFYVVSKEITDDEAQVLNKYIRTSHDFYWQVLEYTVESGAITKEEYETA